VVFVTHLHFVAGFNSWPESGVATLFTLPPMKLNTSTPDDADT